MGTPREGPAFTHGDNKSVLCSTETPESTLQNKKHLIAYHFVRKGAASYERRNSCMNIHENETHVLTKILPSGEKRKIFAVRLLCHFTARSRCSDE